jgi:hypothetical protein
MSLHSYSTTSATKTPIPSEHPAENPDLASILQCHLTPSALHALSVLYPKVFRPN